jgi:cyclohexa-1,5-dienecarbonyl-CoA hydratase
MNDSASPVRVTLEEDGSLLRVLLARPRGNILDTAMVGAIRAALEEHRHTVGLRSILFAGEGPHFSFGASVEEHRPGAVEEMLPEFHRLFRDLAGSGRVLLAAVTGCCLGGGLELAAFCHRLWVAPDGKLGNPEIKLGVFAPIASVILPLRIGQARADDLLLTGRQVDAAEALALGLVDEVSEDPEAAARDWHRRHIMPLSGAALAHAVQAGRHDFHRALRGTLDEVERLYLDDLMATHDAKEGIAAFLEKRAPRWTHA